MPNTPSAHRVRVDSSPLSSSPLRFLSTLLAGESAGARSHPDATRDVWEIAVWDPTPISLRVLCLFSPGHVLVYWLFLPTATENPRPSTTVITTIFLAAVLSTQLLWFQKNFSEQSRDTAVIHKEVMNEYDTKYVHPRTQPLMRDVGTQCSLSKIARHGPPESNEEQDSVDVYMPTFIINRGFQIRPNSNYIKHVDPHGSGAQVTPSRGSITSTIPQFQTPVHLRDASSPIRPQTAVRQPHFRVVEDRNGGSLGVHSHVDSPLRKSTSAHSVGTPVLQKRGFSPQKRESSPLKRSTLAPGSNGQRQDYLQGSSARRESDKH